MYIVKNIWLTHMMHLEGLVKAIDIEGLKFELVKCNFAPDSQQCLDHIIKENFVCPWDDNHISIEDFPMEYGRREKVKKRESREDEISGDNQVIHDVIALSPLSYDLIFIAPEILEFQVSNSSMMT